jgi:hypothetical protein
VDPRAAAAGTLGGEWPTDRHPIPAWLWSVSARPKVEGAGHERLGETLAQPTAAAAVGLSVGHYTRSGGSHRVPACPSSTAEPPDRVPDVALDYRRGAHGAAVKGGDGSRRMIGADSFNDAHRKRAKASVNEPAGDDRDRLESKRRDRVTELDSVRRRGRCTTIPPGVR